MKFAREEVRERMAGVGWIRRQVGAVVIAIASYCIVTSMVNDTVYERAGLDKRRALREAKANEHHKSLMRSSCSGLMDFLSSVGLLTKPAQFFYKRTNLL